MPDEDEDEDERFTRADLERLVGLVEIMALLSRGRPKMMWRTQAERIVLWPGFPKPVVVYPRTGRVHLRLWLPDEVEAWVDAYLDRNHPGWRDNPAVPTE